MEAEGRQLDELSEILKVPAVNNFSADIYTKYNKKGHLLEVKGQVSSELKLQSVISLEYFFRKHTAEFSLMFDTKATLKELKELEVDFDSDVPDIIIDGKIDLADIAIEQLALSMEDNPRQEGESFSFVSEFDEETTRLQNPFSVLAKLKK